MAGELLTVTLVQAPLEWNDKLKNLAYFSMELNKLTVKTDLIVLPEMFATGFVTDPLESYETMDGTVVRWMKETAVRMNCVVTGSVTVKVDNNYFNRLIWMRSDGSYEYYDKRHLFRMGNEHLRFSSGNKPLVVELNGWKIKPLVCYDLRFPVWSMNRLIGNSYEYDVLLYVANWPASRSHAWNTLLMARAIENQAYCIGVNRIGEDAKGIPHIGGSLINDFKGKLITGCEDNKAEVITYTMDYASLSHFRENFSVGPDWDNFEFR